MTEDNKGSLRWLADLMGRAWEPRSRSSGEGPDMSPIADSLLPSDLAVDPLYLLGIAVPSDALADMEDRMSAA